MNCPIWSKLLRKTKSGESILLLIFVAHRSDPRETSCSYVRHDTQANQWRGAFAKIIQKANSVRLWYVEVKVQIFVFFLHRQKKEKKIPSLWSFSALTEQGFYSLQQTKAV